jgi:hypothetical protein
LNGKDVGSRGHRERYVAENLVLIKLENVWKDGRGRGAGGKGKREERTTETVKEGGRSIVAGM